MSSKGGGGGDSTTTQELPDWAKPYAQELLARGEALSNTTTPAYPGQTVADLNATQTGAISGITNAATGQSGVASNASTYANNLTKNGANYSVTNPFTGNVTASTAADAFANPDGNAYLASVVDASNKKISDAYAKGTAASTATQFRNGGAFGGSAYNEQVSNNEKDLADALSTNTSGMYNDAYKTAAQVASQNAAQANNVNLANQSVGTQAGATTNAQNSSNYYNGLNAVQGAISGATGANAGAASTGGTQLAAGAAAQSTEQDKLNAAYQAWLNQVNQPYNQLSTLSSALSGALGSGAGVTTQTGTAGTGNTAQTLLGLLGAGAGAYSAFK